MQGEPLLLQHKRGPSVKSSVKHSKQWTHHLKLAENTSPSQALASSTFRSMVASCLRSRGWTVLLYRDRAPLNFGCHR